MCSSYSLIFFFPSFDSLWIFARIGRTPYTTLDSFLFSISSFALFLRRALLLFAIARRSLHSLRSFFISFIVKNIPADNRKLIKCASGKLLCDAVYCEGFGLVALPLPRLDHRVRLRDTPTPEQNRERRDEHQLSFIGSRGRRTKTTDRLSEKSKRKYHAFLRSPRIRGVH